VPQFAGSVVIISHRMSCSVLPLASGANPWQDRSQVQGPVPEKAQRARSRTDRNHLHMRAFGLPPPPARLRPPRTGR